MRVAIIIFALIIVLALTGLFVVSRSYVSGNAAEIKPTDIINTVLTAILISITAYYAWVTNHALQVSRDMAGLMRQANQINFRPYVQIEGVRPEQLSSMAAKGKGLPIEDVKASGFLFVFTPENREYLVYETRNLGHVPARNIKHSAEVYVVDEKGTASRIPLRSSPTNCGGSRLSPLTTFFILQAVTTSGSFLQRRMLRVNGNAWKEVLTIYSKEPGSKISVSMICVTRLHRGT